MNSIGIGQHSNIFTTFAFMLVTPGILAIISWVTTNCWTVTKNNPMGRTTTNVFATVVLLLSVLCCCWGERKKITVLLGAIFSSSNL